MNSLEIIYSNLERQRKELLKAVLEFKASKSWEREAVVRWLDGMVFSEEDIVDLAIMDFCDAEDLNPINDLRDYQHATIDICLEAWEA